MNPEDAAKSLIAEAHASAVSQFFIENGKDRHVIYIHDIIIKPNGELDIQYSTPSEHVDKEWLYNEVQKAIKLILVDVIQQEEKKQEKKSFFKKVLNLFKGK